MEVLIHQYVNGQSFPCEAVQRTISSLRSALIELQIQPGTIIGGMTKKLISAISPFLASETWAESWPIDQTVFHNAYASYFIDYFRNEDLQSCGHFHRYFLQFMFDNRQAIGTNLMKFEIASRNSIIGGRTPICIAICAEESRIKKLGWDGAAASSQEYLEAINGAYATVLSNPPLIFSIEDLINP
jgi:hypothetical protein